MAIRGIKILESFNLYLVARKINMGPYSTFATKIGTWKPLTLKGKYKHKGHTIHNTPNTHTITT